MARIVALLLLLAGSAAAAKPDYAIVVSKRTKADAAWSLVVAELQDKHPRSECHVYTQSVHDVREALSAQMPRWICFVAQSGEAGREPVAEIQRLVRELDKDPYTDARWGILTGYDAGNALDIACRREPLVIRDVLSGTPIPLNRCESGTWYSELEAGAIGRRAKGEEPHRDRGPADSTAAIVAGLNAAGAELFITSGHATEQDWQIGYRYQNGSFRCAQGRIFGLDLVGQRLPVDSKHDRVYLPVGNCLMGHISGPDCMALAFMNSAAVRQMAGYTVPTWFGYAGWGMLDYFLNQPGRYSLAEAFIANQHALDHRAGALPPTHGDQRGLTFDRTVFAFYGDPAWDARLADGLLNWSQSLTREGSRFIFKVQPRAGAESFAAIDTNGSQRGGRPLIAFLPERLPGGRVVEGAEWNPVVADDFLLVPLPAVAPEQGMRIVIETAGGHHVRSGEAAPGDDVI